MELVQLQFFQIFNHSFFFFFPCMHWFSVTSLCVRVCAPSAVRCEVIYINACDWTTHSALKDPSRLITVQPVSDSSPSVRWNSCLWTSVCIHKAATPTSTIASVRNRRCGEECVRLESIAWVSRSLREIWPGAMFQIWGSSRCYSAQLSSLSILLHDSGLSTLASLTARKTNLNTRLKDTRAHELKMETG